MTASLLKIESIEQLVSIVKLADQQMLKPKIVAIGGGTGLAVLLKELRHYPADLTAVVTGKYVYHFHLWVGHTAC